MQKLPSRAMFLVRPSQNRSQSRFSSAVTAAQLPQLRNRYSRHKCYQSGLSKPYKANFIIVRCKLVSGNYLLLKTTLGSSGVQNLPSRALFLARPSQSRKQSRFSSAVTAAQLATSETATLMVINAIKVAYQSHTELISS